ncbi:hypothetical protein EVAR_19130_1 [Eumeta japonica]|uniref:Reverse transcriptase domain-containing protein n=1 Tax=Eumeta variegata TaxID=151549 RepID=A0A4C1ST06_EUMVA|nr:hypothetical protein EVAR_19130_1 [Eumeta japonica]
MVSLDIGAPSTTRGGRRWRPSALGCPVNLHGLVRGYLRDREVVVKYAGGVQERDFKGCIQGSIAGPTFWNLILDSTPRTRGTRRIRAGVRG